MVRPATSMRPPTGVCSYEKGTKQSHDSLQTLYDIDSSAVATQRVVHRPSSVTGERTSKIAVNIEPSCSVTCKEVPYLGDGRDYPGIDN